MDPYWGKAIPPPPAIVDAVQISTIDPVRTFAAAASVEPLPAATSGVHPDDAAALDALARILKPEPTPTFRDGLASALAGAGVPGDGSDRALAASDRALASLAAWADQSNPSFAAQLRSGMAILGAVRSVLA